MLLNKLLSIITAISFLLPYSAFAIASLADTPNITVTNFNGASNSFTYTVPSGSNQTLILRLNEGTNDTITATQNGTSLTVVGSPVGGNGPNCGNAGYEWYGYLVAPTSGTFTVNGTAGTQKDYAVYTVNDSNQTTPIDQVNCKVNKSTTEPIGTTTPTNANAFLMSWLFAGNGALSSHGAGQTEYALKDNSANLEYMTASYVNGSTTANTIQGMSDVWTVARNIDVQIMAIAPVAAAAAAFRAPFFNVTNFDF